VRFLWNLWGKVQWTWTHLIITLPFVYLNTKWNLKSSRKSVGYGSGGGDEEGWNGVVGEGAEEAERGAGGGAETEQGEGGPREAPAPRRIGSPLRGGGRGGAPLRAARWPRSRGAAAGAWVSRSHRFTGWSALTSTLSPQHHLSPSFPLMKPRCLSLHVVVKRVVVTFRCAMVRYEVLTWSS